MSQLFDTMDCSLSGSSVHGILQARILECCHFLLQRIFLTQGSNLVLLHYRQILDHLSYKSHLSSGMETEEAPK